jgi:hypothetical protein
MEYYHVLVVGCGGTGSSLLPWLARYVAAKKATIKVHISIIDGDAVEYKNLSRQIYTDEDTGRNKAIVFSEAIYETFGLATSGYSSYINNREDIDCLLAQQQEQYTRIIVGCVDNAVCRSVLKSYFYNNRYNNLAYIDTGNDYMDGQCVVALKKNGVVVSPAYDYYFGENLEGQKARSDMSCSELNAATPQHFAVNLLSAWVAFSALVAIFEGRPMRGLVKFDASKMMLDHEEPEQYGFCVDQQVRDYLLGMDSNSRHSLASRGMFLQWFARDEEPMVRRGVLDYISAHRKEAKDDGCEKFFKQLLDVLGQYPEHKKTCAALKGQITKIRKAV